MELLREVEPLRDACQEARARGERVGLVPTMGALHDGHMALVREARERTDRVVVTIFVNPTQFGPNEDLSRYPRTLDADRARCEETGVDLLFAPSDDAMYPPGEETRVRVGATARALCGEHRPGHFEGVCTIVAKLFVLVGPCTAFFGRKDYQQWRVIRRMARDLGFSIDVVGVPTVREPDGLALSSRNAYLSSAERARALAISRGLRKAVRAFEGGERQVAALRGLCVAEVEAAADRVDYIELATPDDVQPLPGDARVGERALLAVAARIGTTRLIDNVVLGEDPAPNEA
jgi:pantoate--beta-alanine ligase